VQVGGDPLLPVEVSGRDAQFVAARDNTGVQLLKWSLCGRDFVLRAALPQNELIHMAESVRGERD
jgi:hypothetical protein